MARYTGPKNKKARRAGTDLGLTTSGQKLQRRLNIPPGQHGRKRQGRQSDYGIQLAEKQKLKWMFGVLERQFVRYYKQATKTKGATGKMLLQMLERRLDNVVYRLNLAPTRQAARQLITHGHITVDGKKVSIPSYRLKVGQIVTPSPKAIGFSKTKQLLAQKEVTLPKWLIRKAAVGKIKRLPDRDDMDLNIDEQLIVEYYSR